MMHGLEPCCCWAARPQPGGTTDLGKDEGTCHPRFSLTDARNYTLSSWFLRVCASQREVAGPAHLGSWLDVQILGPSPDLQNPTRGGAGTLFQEASRAGVLLPAQLRAQSSSQVLFSKSERPAEFALRFRPRTPLFLCNKQRGRWVPGSVQACHAADRNSFSPVTTPAGAELDRSRSRSRSLSRPFPVDKEAAPEDP